jgi:hypothetical protein
MGEKGHLRTLALRQTATRSLARRPFITASTSTPIGAAARADPSAGTIAAAHRRPRAPISAVLDLLAPKAKHPNVS